MKIEQSLQQAITHHQMGRIEDAIKIYRNILKIEPKHPAANHHLGLLLIQEAQPSAALELFLTALESNPNSSHIWISYIDTLIYLGQLDWAKKILEQGRTNGLEGEAFDQLEILLAHECERNQSSQLQSQIDSVVALYQNSKPREVLDALDVLIKKYPYESELYNLSGICFVDLGQLNTAIQYYQQAIEIKPNYAEAQCNLGVAHQKLGQIDVAAKCYLRAIEIIPDYANAYSNLGSALMDLGKLDAAVKCYNQALKFKPDYAEAHSNLGNVLQELNQLDSAVKCYEQALKIRPNFADAHYNLGIAFKNLNKPNCAIKCYNRALEIKPDYPEALCNLGLALQELGQLDAAVKCHEQALKIKPDYVNAYNNLGNALKEQHQLDVAILNYKQALALQSDFADAHYNLGNALKEFGKLDEAVKCYKRVLKINPENHSAQHILNSLLGQNAQSAPREYVEELFNNYAKNFEKNVVKNLKYKTPSLLRKTFLNTGVENKIIPKALDLGCGTGLCGIEFRDLTEILIGIDLSSQMISKAKQKNIYDELYVNDLTNGIERLKTKFDLFIASDVFVYVGDLRPLFKTVKNHANENAWFIFSTEDSDADCFYLQKTGRFSHSKNYIIQLAFEHGFQLEHFERSNLRKDKGKWIIGGIYLLRCINNDST